MTDALPVVDYVELCWHTCIFLLLVGALVVCIDRVSESVRREALAARISQIKEDRMSYNENVNPTVGRWPAQTRVGEAVSLVFHHDTDRIVPATCVRYDTVAPFVRAFRMEDGRIVLGSECAYAFTVDVNNMRKALAEIGALHA